MVNSICNYSELEFTHFVIDSSDGTIFGSARVNGSGRVANFLINGWIKEQHSDYWRELQPEEAEQVRQRIQAAYGCVPTYRRARLLF